MDLKTKIREIQDFPEKGVLFRDITTLLKEPAALVSAVNQMQATIETLEFDFIAGAESRGFLFSMPIAYNMKKGFIPIRKEGKLPAETLKKKYSLEYGSATIEMHKDAILPGQKVVIIDDLLATGGTAKAMADLIAEAGGEVVAFSFLISLEELGGSKLLEGYPVFSLLKY